MKRIAEILSLSLILTSFPNVGAARQNPGPPGVGGAALPDAITIAMHTALEQVLMDQVAKMTGPAQDPNGAPFGDAIKMGLVLIKETTIEQFQQAQQQLIALKNASPDVREAELAKIRDFAVEARDAYRDMRAIERDELKGDLNGEARGTYEVTMREAETLDKAGRHAEAEARRQQAAQTRWGGYLKARQRFYAAAGAHPLLAVRLAGGASDLFLDQTYFFNKVLESAVPRRGTGVSVATLLKLMDDHIDRGVELLKEQQTRFENMTTWQAVWELGNPAFDATQRQATGVGGDLGKGLVDAVTATNNGATAVHAYNNALPDAALSVVQVGSMLIPIAGPFISAGITGIQVYKSGDEFVIALTDLKNATGGAAVTGQEVVFEAKDRAGSAAGTLVVNIAMAPAEIPGLIDAMKAGKVLVKRGTATLTRVAGDASKVAKVGEETKAIVKTGEAAEAGSKAAAGRTGSVVDRAERGAQKARDLGLPESEIKKAENYLERTRTAARTGEGGLLTTAATKTLVGLDDVEALIVEARLAGVPEQEIEAMVARAKRTATLEGYVEILSQDLFTSSANKKGTIFVVDKSAVERFKEFFSESVVKPQNVIATDALTLEAIRTNLGFMKAGRTVTWTPRELEMLQTLMRGAAGDPLKMMRFVSDEKVFISIFTQEHLDVARKFITSPEAAKIATGAAIFRDVAPTALLNAGGDLMSAEQAAKLTTGELSQVPFDFVRQMDRRDPLTQALAKRFADAGDATAKAWARDVLATANAAKAAAATPISSPPPAVTPPVRPGTATAASGSTSPGSSASKPPPSPPPSSSGGLTKEDERRAAEAASKDEPPPAARTPTGLDKPDEKRASDAMLKAETGMAPRPAPGGYVCGTSDCGVLTIHRNNLIDLTLPDGVTSYPGVITTGGFELFPPGTPVAIDALPSNPVLIAPATPIPTGNMTVSPDGSITYGGVPINGLSRTPTGGGFICGTSDCLVPGSIVPPGPGDPRLVPGPIDPAFDEELRQLQQRIGTLLRGNGTVSPPANPPAPLTRDEALRQVQQQIATLLRGNGTVSPPANPPASLTRDEELRRLQQRIATLARDGATVSPPPVVGAPRLVPGPIDPPASGGPGGSIAIPPAPLRPAGRVATPGGLTFTPPVGKDKNGPVTGGAETNNVIGGGGLPFAPSVPPGPGFGWGESESTTTDPVEDPEHFTPGGDPLVQLGGGDFGGDPGGCCFPGVQSLMFDIGSPMTVSPILAAPRGAMDRGPSWPWLMRDVASALTLLAEGLMPSASARALWLGNLPIGLPPAHAQQTPSNPRVPGGRLERVRGAAPALRTIITSLGASQGDAFDLQILNEGLSAVQVAGSGVVVEPLKREAQRQLQQQLAKLARGNAATRRVEAYCLAFGLNPPTPGMLFQIAPPDIQQKFAPVRAVLAAGQKLSAAGLLHPDTAAKSYLESIKQYAIWTKVENWNVKRFGEVWVEKTKANAAALKRNWTREMENALISAAPGRWRDIQAILQEAGNSK